MYGCVCETCGTTYETPKWRPPFWCEDCMEAAAHAVNTFTRPRKGEYRKAS